MSDKLIVLLIMIVISSIFIVGFFVCLKTDIENMSILNSTKNFVIDLFKDRNIFGKFLSSIIFILSIPFILFVIILTIVDIFIKLLMRIWKLGNR